MAESKWGIRVYHFEVYMRTNIVTNDLAVRLRNALGAFDDQQGLGQDAWVGRRMVVGVGEAPVLPQALADGLVG